MLTKKSVRAEFSKDWKKHYEVELFRKEGFLRKTCFTCRKNFWTLDPKRTTCGSPPCDPYGFIKNPITKQSWDYISMWRLFEAFFKKNGHTPVSRYPVVDRWRPDLYFTIASIQDFQRLENGNMTFEYPANPLVVPQVCLRFPDIANVGVTGRHLTSFIMSGQHAFGHPETGYFKDRCLELNFRFLTEEMGINPKELTYVEDVWAMTDFSAFGPCVETFCRGLELVNSVFMQFQSDDGKGYRELDMKVIDVGWGHERLVWFSQGTPAAYDAVFGPVTEKMKEKAKLKVDHKAFDRYAVVAGDLDLDDTPDREKALLDTAKKIGISLEEMQKVVEPLQALYAVADHSRTLLFAVADGAIPSNVGGGYNLRVIFRRAMNFIEKYNLNLSVSEVASWHADYLKPLFPELAEAIPNMKKILAVEEEKYGASRERAKRMVEGTLRRTGDLGEKEMMELYTSHGITPELLESTARAMGKKVKVPPDFYSKLSETHAAEEKKKVKHFVDITGVAKTKMLFYDTNDLEFDAKVLGVFDNKWVALDETAFYATGGGQEHDTGMLSGLEVANVQKIGKIILHEVNGAEKLKIGQAVHGVVDKNRREILTKMHTGAHVLGAAIRSVLGPHIWQAGSHKTPEKARLDVTHYAHVTDDERKKIEDEANKIIDSGIDVDVKDTPRGKAERSYGFGIYQGGGSPGSMVRIVKVGEHDIEACGGTHVSNTKDIGVLKILGTTKIQDGVIRFNYVVGSKAAEAEEKKIDAAEEVLKLLGAKEAKDAPGLAEALFKDWKVLRKLYGQLMGAKHKKDDGAIARVKAEFAGFKAAEPVIGGTKLTGEGALKEISRILKTDEGVVVNTVKRFREERKAFAENLVM